MPGPLPKPEGQRRRRNATPAGLKLPRAGRVGAPPAWPLERDRLPEERQLWEDVWRSPQAVAWEKLGLERIVARYVRVFVASGESLVPALLAETRQLEDKLGLHPAALQRLRWEIVDDAPELAGVPSEVATLADYRAMFAG